MSSTVNAVALVIYDSDRSGFLIARRPENAEYCPNLWGLIAGYVGEGETFRAAAFRAGQQKLGVILVPTDFIGKGRITRPDQVLYMEEYEARILQGTPSVPQPFPDVTQYTRLAWGTPDDLLPAARGGSLCSRIYLESIGRRW